MRKKTKKKESPAPIAYEQNDDKSSEQIKEHTEETNKIEDSKETVKEKDSVETTDDFVVKEKEFVKTTDNFEVKKKDSVENTDDFVVKEKDSADSSDNFEEIKREIEEVNIKFAYAKAELDTETRSFLDKAAKLIKDKDIRLLITGHTCSIGTLEYNQKLSERRAQSVKRYLTEKGIPSKKISIDALGERRPTADNSTEEGRRKNRRAELIVLPRRRD